MKAKRVGEFHKYGEHFYGNLVVVDYTEDIKNDPKMGTWNAGVSFDYVERAAALVEREYGTPVKVLLHIPEYVCVVK